MPEAEKPKFSISIVSHGHREFVHSLLKDLAKLKRSDIEVILTWNLISEGSSLNNDTFPFRIVTIRNAAPKGFAANHNYAFEKITGSNFVILNPDISIPEDPFPALTSILENYNPCICAPIIKNQDGQIEDSARFFPSPLILVKKAAAKILKRQLQLDKVPTREKMLNPDWIAGMFMVIPYSIYRGLGGLSEQYYLYYEDVDFCARARRAGIDIFVTQVVAAIHYAQRSSHNNFRFFRWHAESAIRFLASKAYIQLMFERSLKKIRRLVTGHSE